MKIETMNGLLSIAYIVSSAGLVTFFTWLNQATGMRIGVREDAPTMELVAGGVIQRIEPGAVVGIFILCAVVVGAAIGWELPALWLVEGRETWLDRSAQVMGCLFWGMLGYLALGWLVQLAIAFAALGAMVWLGYAAIAYVFPSVGQIDWSHYAPAKNNMNFVTRWRAQRLIDEAKEHDEEKAAALQKFMAPFVGRWVIKNTNGDLVEVLSIDKGGIEESNGKGIRKRGMAIDWNSSGKVLEAKHEGLIKRRYLIEGAEILVQRELVGPYEMNEKKFTRAAQ